MAGANSFYLPIPEMMVGTANPETTETVSFPFGLELVPV